MKTRTEERAYEDGLELVTITQGMNGYPSGLYKAVAGFESFEDAESFADDVNGEVVLLSRRDGHQFWTNNGRQYEPLFTAHYIDDETEVAFELVKNFYAWAHDDIEAMVEQMCSLRDLKSALVNMCAIYDEMLEMGEDEIAVIDTLNYTCDIRKTNVTRIHDDDVTTYLLAVVDHETDEDEIEAEDED